MKDYPRGIMTDRGDLVRSNYERVVANFLYSQDIDYVYEKPLKLSDGRLFHPDFYLPDYDCYIEIWGMTGNGRYNYLRHGKRDEYARDSIKLIELWPEHRINFKWFLKKKFEEILGVPFPAIMRVPFYPLKRY